MTSYGSTETSDTATGKRPVGFYVVLILLTLVAAAALTLDALSGETAEYPEQLDPTTLDDAP